MDTEKASWRMNHDSLSFLRERWVSLASQSSDDTKLIGTLFSEIEAAYNAPGRHYHNLRHIYSLLALSDEYRQYLHEKEAVDFAIFYHDIVYDVFRSDNEEKSAAIAEAGLTMLEIIPQAIADVVSYIIASKRHHVEGPDLQTDLAWFLDFDMSILGSDLSRYRQYLQEVRQEYISYPDEIFNAGRRKFLAETMSMPFIFHTPSFRATYEQQARTNMEWELALLSAS